MTHLHLVGSNNDQPPREIQQSLDQWCAYQASIERAFQPLLEKLQDLETDWSVRSADFWQKVLTALQALKTLVSPMTVNVKMLPILLPIRYDLLDSLYHVLELLDETGIDVTSYLPRCRSTRLCHLQQRQRILECMRKLARAIQETLIKTGLQGQQRLLSEHLAYSERLAQLKKE